MDDQRNQQQQPPSSLSATSAAVALVMQALRLLPVHLTAAYAEAVLMAPELVQQESDPVLFLRKTNMNVQNAAIMIAVYWTRRKAIFGQRAYLPLMTMTAAASASAALSGGTAAAAVASTALGPLDMAAIQGGCLQVLPRDSMGHVVYFVDTQKITTSLSSEQGLRCLFYQLQRANSATLSSTEGIIQLWLVRDQTPFAVLEAFVNLLSGLLQQAMPVNIQRLHIISSSPNSAVVSALTQLVFAKSLCEECVVTAFSSHQDLLSKLLFYGMTEDCLPIELGGSYDNRSSVSMAMMQEQSPAQTASRRHDPNTSPLNIFQPHLATAAHPSAASSSLLLSPGGGGAQDIYNAPLLQHAGLYPDDERTIPLGFGMSVPPRPALVGAMMPAGLQQEQDYSNVVAAMLRQRKQQNWLEASMLDAKLPATTRKRPPTELAGSAAVPSLAVGVGGGGGSSAAMMSGDLSEFSSRGSSANTSGVMGAAMAQLKPCPPSSVQEQHRRQVQQQQQQSDESQTAAERAEHLRQRNALYTRRSYHKSKIELQVLQDQVEQLRTQQQNLAMEQERLQQLHQQAEQCLNKQKTNHAGEAVTQNQQESSVTSQNAPAADAEAAPEAAEEAAEEAAPPLLPPSDQPARSSSPHFYMPAPLTRSSPRNENDDDNKTATAKTEK